jgi:lipoprotein-anchoring transpeptidase ErfK/SrfK
MKISKSIVAVGVAGALVTGVIAMQLPDSAAIKTDSVRVSTLDPAAGPVSVRVSLSARELYVEQSGSVVQTYPVTVGTSAHPTPKGSFRMKHIVWNPRWVPPDEKWAKGKTAKGPGEKGNPMGKVKIFFNEPDYYIHGTLSVEELGTAASHGCIRMRNADAIELASTLMDHGGAPVESSFIRRLIARVRTTKEVRLRNGIPLTIASQALEQLPLTIAS